jgi:hypothetical protein
MQQAMIDDEDQRTLSALLDVLLPGTDGFPSGSAAGVGPRLSSSGIDVALIRQMLDELTAAFVYRAYYTAPAVLAVISAATGYRHPPQPAGYALPAFDETILEKVKRDPPSWRDAPSPNIEGSRQ